MLKNLNLETFIQEKVIERSESMFRSDLDDSNSILSEKIDGKTALVIGGAGTIGSSFIKALLRFRPVTLVVVDINENGLTELIRDLRSSADLNLPNEIKTYPINFSDAIFKKILLREGPFDIVANFAAHKHVRSEKDQYSIEAMIDNNVINAKRLLDLLVVNPPEHFFCVSTDKAANPVNVMGASKKLMEELIMDYSDRMKVTTARFANVAFSNGSLPFGFIERLSKRQPFSSPLNIKRYFVSPAESGQICLMACILGNSGEIFFPKLDNTTMKTFSAIAEDFLRGLGLEPVRCESEEHARRFAEKLEDDFDQYPVYFFDSDTSGEKPFEEFFTSTEIVDNERFKGLGVVTQRDNLGVENIELMISDLVRLFAKEEVTKTMIIDLLKSYIPNFGHIEKGKSLDQRM